MFDNVGLQTSRQKMLANENLANGIRRYEHFGGVRMRQLVVDVVVGRPLQKPVIVSWYRRGQGERRPDSSERPVNEGPRQGRGRPGDEHDRHRRRRRPNENHVRDPRSPDSGFLACSWSASDERINEQRLSALSAPHLHPGLHSRTAFGARLARAHPQISVSGLDKITV